MYASKQAGEKSVLLEGDLLIGIGRRVGVGLGAGCLACVAVRAIALREELKVAPVKDEVDSGFAVVADPRFWLFKAAFDVDGIALFDVLGDDFRGVAEEFGFVPHRTVGPILTGAGAVVSTD